MKNKMTEKLFELAYTDSMTEVQNRNAYEGRLKKLRKPNANISRITVIVVDVNGLKEINDGFGHFCGDDAIKTVAKALRETIGAKADIYRIGGDEFVCISESNVLPYLTPLTLKIYAENKGKLHTLARQSSVRPHKYTGESKSNAKAKYSYRYPKCINRSKKSG